MGVCRSKENCEQKHVQRRDRGGRREEMFKDFSACSASSRLRSALFSPCFGEARRSASRAQAAACKRRIFADSEDLGYFLQNANRCQPNRRTIGRGKALKVPTKTLL